MYGVAGNSSGHASNDRSEPPQEPAVDPQR